MSSFDNNQDYEEAKKRRYLVIGVSIFSVFIILIWITSLRYSFSDSFNRDNQKSSADSNAWQKEINETIESIKEVSFQAKDNKSTETTAKEQAFLQAMSADLTSNVEEKRILKEKEDLKLSNAAGVEMLLELENKLESSKNCPEYIDCMPTIGGSNNCVIRPGCENITKIAY